MDGLKGSQKQYYAPIAIASMTVFPFSPGFQTKVKNEQKKKEPKTHRGFEILS